MLNGSTEPSIYKLSSRAPRFIFTQLWDIFIVWIQTLPIYPANNIRRASSRILIAAFRSRSIRFPHVQRYTLSEVQFFLYIATFTAFFTGRKKNGLHVPVSFLSMSAYIPAIPGTSITVVHDTFSKMHTLAHCFHVNIFYCNNIIYLCYFMTQFMQKIFPLVSDCFMT